MAKGKSSGGGGKSAPKGNARSAITGKFVTKGHAKSNPRTTVVSRAKKK